MLKRRRDREKAKAGRGQPSGLWRQSRQLLAAAVVAVMVAGSLLVQVEAAAGDLDTTFSTDGKLTTNFGVRDEGQAVAIQSDGKIVVAGSAYNSSTYTDFALARYQSNGALDTTFSHGGKLTTDFSGGQDYASDMAIQSDGKIVVVGVTVVGITNYDFALARYNSNGTLDTTFSNDGKQTTSFGGIDSAQAVAIQANGKIVVVGYDTGHNFAVARYKSNGTLDTTFDTDGKQTTDFGGQDAAYGVAIQANGKIVAVGATEHSSTDIDFALARYNGNGSLDTTFSTDGKQTTDFGSVSAAYAVAIQSDGKIVVAGRDYTTTTNSNFAVARYKGNGSLDTTFSTDGKEKTDFLGSHDAAYAVAIQSDGKIVVAGYAAHANDKNHDFALARYSIDGTLDTTFSGNGLQHTGFIGSSKDTGRAVAIQSDGKIVVAGTTEYGPNNSAVDFALARYLGD